MSYKIDDNVITYTVEYCINCTYGDNTPATHNPEGLGPKCCYDNDCSSCEMCGTCEQEGCECE